MKDFYRYTSKDFFGGGGLNFEWKRRKFTGEPPIAPWHLVTAAQSKIDLTKFDMDEVNELIMFSGEWWSIDLPIRLGWVHSISEVTVIRSEKWNELEEMYSVLTRYADDSRPGLPFGNVLGAPGYVKKKLVESPEAGMVVMVKGSLEDKYVRAMICGKARGGGGKWDVVFLDFGDVREVDGSDIFHLPHKFAQLPYTAIQVSLEGVHPMLRDWRHNVNLLVSMGGFVPEEAKRVMTDIWECSMKRFRELVSDKELLCTMYIPEGATKLSGRLLSLQKVGGPVNIVNLLSEEISEKWSFLANFFTQVYAEQEEADTVDMENRIADLEREEDVNMGGEEEF